MIFRETPLPGAWVLEPKRFEDERGFFARTYSRGDFAERGLETEGGSVQRLLQLPSRNPPRPPFPDRSP